ncbi:amino acid adenylation domain-containing protein [Paenibacillus xylanexedens]|uniref:non-ribosomal peptide synthetase n=1 Tax=Paenibacillus xylanexedens TaxID=528191 RepID=UPI00164381B0|nr:non-ribosomal peptide synthetase [Paenibacillus xylanexedens]
MNTHLSDEVHDDVYVFPLSFAQQRLWFIQQLDPDSSAYHMNSLWRLEGELDLDVLQRSVQELVDRHESLRTFFREEEGTAVQCVAERLHACVDVIELGDADEQAAVDWISRRAADPYEMSKGSLFRAVLIPLEPKKFVFSIMMHHIISDGWSMNVLMNELRALYSAFLHHQPSPLPDLPLQYVDYTMWQRELLEGTLLDTQLDYWKNKLRGAEVLQLPTDAPKLPFQSARGGKLEFTVDSSLIQSLRQIAQQEGATLYMAMLTAFKLLLQRYSGQVDISVGTVNANRNREELEGVFGFFANTLVIRSLLSADTSFRSHLRQVKQNTIEAYAHQDVPFEKIVEALQPDRSMTDNALFQVFFSMASFAEASIDMAGVSLVELEPEIDTVSFDLTLSLQEQGDCVKGTFLYHADLFKEATLGRMADSFGVLLQSIVHSPNEAVGHLPILSEHELHKQLVEWNDTERDVPEISIHELWQQKVNETPDALAVTCGAVQLTYIQLNQQANQLARYMQERGVREHNLVGICLDKSVQMVVSILAVLKAGAAYVPIDPSYPPERLSYMLQDASPHTMVINSAGLEHLSMDSMNVICLDREYEQISLESTKDIESTVASDSMAYVIYTSGSTGKPKGVMIAHRGVVNLALDNIETFAVTPADHVMQFASFSFDGSVFETMTALLSGASLHIYQRGEDLGAFLQRQHITFGAFPPSVLATLEEEEVANLRVMIVAGEKCPAELIEKYNQHNRMYNSYGPSESTVAATVYQYRVEQPDSIGRPITNSRVYILDQYLQPVPVGVQGEIYIAGRGLALGYLNKPDLTAERFVESRFHTDERLYKTGDLGRYYTDGSIQFLGRTDYQVKIRGFRIELGEVEATLAEHPHVDEVLVDARANHLGDQTLVAYLVLKENYAWDYGPLEKYAQERLPIHMVPSHWVFVPEFPLTPNNKIDRKALADPVWEDEATMDTDQLTQEEARLRDLWIEVLGSGNPIGSSSNFFKLGGHSLKAMQLISKINKSYGVQLAVKQLFMYPTLSQLAVSIQKGIIHETNQIRVPLQAGRGEKTLFVIHPQGGDVLGYLDLVRQLEDDVTVYGLQARGYNSEETPLTTIEDMAQAYLQEMDQVQSHGPYHILGWSFGGYIAVEITRLLEQRGDEVALLGIVDVPAEAIKAGADSRSTSVPSLSMCAATQLGLTMEMLDGEVEEYDLAQIYALAKKWNRLPPGLTMEQMTRNARIMVLNQRAIEKYILKGKLRTDIHLWYASQPTDTHQVIHPSGWHGLSLGKVYAQELACNHFTIVTTPYVHVIAEKLNHFVMMVHS